MMIGEAMRILVMSDCHMAIANAERVLEKHGDIKHVFFLGDGASAIDEMKSYHTDKSFHIVSGNCDMFSTFPDYGETVIDGVRIAYMHGHRYGVKYGTESLFKLAQSINASLVLYGHTHIASVEYRDGIYVINPGALSGSREGPNGYAVIDVTSQGIVPSIMKI